MLELLIEISPAIAAAQISGWVMFLVVVLSITLPFALGGIIGRWLKMKEHSFKMGVVLLTVVLGLAPFVYQIALGKAEYSAYLEDKAVWEVHERNRAKITDQGVGKLETALPDLNVRR